MAAILAAASPASEKIAQLARHSMQDAVSQLSRFQSIWLEFYALAGRPGGFRERMMVYMNQYIEALTGLIQGGIAQGAIRAVAADQAAMVAAGQCGG